MKALVFFAIGIVTADPAAASAEHIETITVTAQREEMPIERATVPVELIGESAIERRVAATPEDLLRGAPGVSLARSGGTGALTELRLRGAEANHVLVLVDGVEVNDPATGSAVDFSQLSLTGVNRIEVLRGPQSALWGSDAIAGVVYFDTTPAPDTRQRTVSTSAGSNGARTISADIGANDSVWHYDIAARHGATSGTNVSRAGSEDDGYESSTLHVNTGYRATDWSIQAIARRTSAQVEYDPTPFPAFLPADGDLESHLDHALARLDLRVATQSALQHRLTADYFDSRNRAFDAGVATDSSDADKLRLGYQSHLTIDAERHSHRLIAAVEYERERFRQRGVATPFGDPNQNQHLHNRALVGEWSVDLDTGIGFSLSARHEDNSDFRDAASYRAAARAPLSPSTTLFASYGSGRKNPTFTERFGFTPDTFIGNPELDPERSTGYSITLQHTISTAIRGEVTYFRDRLRDEIDGFVFDATRGAFTARNDSSTSRRQGAELSVHAKTERLAIGADYTFIDATENDDGRSVREARRARHTGRLWLDVDVAANASMQIGATYTGARYDLDFAEFPARRVTLRDYVLLHLAARYRFSTHLSAFVRADNLGDADYEDVFGYATPGRTFELGLVANF